ncbi:MAG: RecX family transcriptional regulator [Pseudomonadota bacterium]|nr:RecX family transcriptional regulator [Pseudomonadota bacterium]
MQARLSLKGRAFQLLAQRDQSRVELRRKLLRHTRGDAPESSADEDGDGENKEEAVEALLDWLEAHRYLSVERFVEARVHARESRFGNLRIKSELAQHGVALSAVATRALAETELRRAANVRERRFSRPPGDASERAAQSRFLAARGFSSEVIHRLMRQVGTVPTETGESGTNGRN